MEEVRQKGDLVTMEYMVYNIADLCKLREQLIGEDCQQLLDEQEYKDFLNGNYAAFVQNMRDELADSSVNITILVFQMGPEPHSIWGFTANTNCTIYVQETCFYHEVGLNL